MHRAFRAAALAAATLAAGCGVMKMKGSTPVDSGGPAPSPVIIAQLEFVPRLQPQQISTIEAKKYTLKNVMGFWATPDRRPIDWDDFDESGWSRLFFGGPIDEWFSLKQSGVSVVPWRTGMTYIRRGTYVLRDYCAVVAVGAGCRAMGQDTLEMYRDLQFEVPAGSTAVYIGKLVVHHNGALATSVRVVDDYAGAMAALRREPVAGVDPRSVRKRLAVVLGRSGA